MIKVEISTIIHIGYFNYLEFYTVSGSSILHVDLILFCNIQILTRAMKGCVGNCKKETQFENIYFN